jgi:hypothetical protein
MYIALIISDSLFLDTALVIKYSALIPLLLLRLRRMPIVFDENLERLLGSPVHRHIWRLLVT